jgi:hydroxymethylpyrimidine pyrophosphatase-like HAD family hydrolase
MDKQYKLALATDLDGTFLEGHSQAKNYFYNELMRLREDILLIYVTGRPTETVKQFCLNGYLPNPHFVIGDLGTHIVEGVNFYPLEPLQNPIIQKWNNSNCALRELLRDDAGLHLQPIDPPYRVAYYYDPNLLQEQTLEKIITAGFDVIQSSEMYLDIVPRDVNKGSSLLSLIDYLNVDREIVITSGDSLNDLSLFQTGLKSIAVSNSEPKLIDEIKKLTNVYLSDCPGLLGVIDGLQFYERAHLFLHPEPR